MRFLGLKAYLKLLYFDFYLARGNFEVLYDKVRLYPLRKPAAVYRTSILGLIMNFVAGRSIVTPTFGSVERICAAVDIACIWYWKEALCLQRSAATACLLRRCGIPAQMVIGVQQMPFKAHAWVEVDGRVVNDKPYTPEVYAALDRC